MTDIQELAERLRSEITSAFDPDVANSNYVSPISRTTVRHDDPDKVPSKSALGVAAVIDLINTVIRGQPANPSRADSVTRLDAAYALEAPRAQLTESGTQITSYDTISNMLEKYLIDSNYVALVGARGIGKTNLVNRWLNHRSRVLEDEWSYTWFRVDMSKVYRLKYDRTIDSAQATVKNYYIVHAVYVILFYSGFLIIDPARISSLFSLIATEADDKYQYSEFKFSEYVEEFSALCERINRLHQGEYLSERTVHAVFQKQNRRLFDRTLEVWTAFSELLRNAGYGILSIVDGIDNIAWSKDNAQYKNACSETTDFISTIRDLTDNEKSKVLVVARPETIPEVSFDTIWYGYNDNQKMTPPGINFWVIQLMVPIVRSIIEKKIVALDGDGAFAEQRAAARKGIAEYNHRNPTAAISLDETVSEFVDCLRTFLSTVSTEISNILSSVEKLAKIKFDHDVSEAGIIETVFDNDIRALLDCTIRAYRSRGVAEQHRVRGFDHNRRMLEYMVLGGRYFLDSRPHERKHRSVQIPRGDVFPNIFWFDQAQTAAMQSIWHGLAGYRLLRFIEQRPLPAQDALSVVHSSFGYHPDLLVTHLEDFIAFGLIDVQAFSYQSPFFPASSPRFEGIKSFVQVSKKGRFILDFSFAYVDWLYFLALDTPLHRLAVSDSKRVRFYRFADNPNISAYNYFDAFVPTVTTFAKHLIYYDRKELREFRLRESSLAKQYPGLIEDWAVATNWLSIPSWFFSNTLTELRSAVTQRRKIKYAEEQYTFEDLQNDLIGAFGNKPNFRA
ncbi:MAG: hypothetical protein QOF14_3719 [Hyphomicrobiales bacterium]|jgi:hypothetical protein|nr:hypothetical protein [Hyphomicrobiales bacterium]